MMMTMMTTMFVTPYHLQMGEESLGNDNHIIVHGFCHVDDDDDDDYDGDDDDDDDDNLFISRWARTAWAAQ